MIYFGAILNTFFLILVVSGLIFFVDSLAKQEKAKKYAKKLVADFNLQFLDDSIYCKKIWIVEGNKYPFNIKRKYHFFASPFNERKLACNLVMIGSHMTDWYIEPYRE